nr:hypothetical protein [Tanacetum cinerariifolium]
MAKLLRAPTEGHAEAIVVPPILVEHFELKHNLINLVTSKQFFGFEKEDPHAHIRYFNKITSTLKYKDVPEFAIKLMLFPFSIDGPAQIWLDKEPSLSILTWDDLCPATDVNTYSGYQDNIQGYVSAAAVNYNQGNTGYRPQRVANQFRPSSFAQPNLQYNQTRYNQGYNQDRGNYQGNTSYKALIPQIQVATSRSLPSNTVANPRGELKAIATRSGVVLDRPSVPMPHPFINPEEGEQAEETLTDPELAEYTIKKMLKNLLSNKEKLLELANTPLNENCSAVILKKLPEKLVDPQKFLIPCDFKELKCKALADLGASINLIPLLIWKKLGLPELVSTRMTLELANRSICTPARIARDVFVPVGRFAFPADFVIVNYKSDPRVLLILERPFLRTARALIDVHGEELILRDGDERLILNMKHDTLSYSNKPQRESINMIDIYNISNKDYLEDLFENEKITNNLRCNLTFSSKPDTLTSNLTSSEVKDDIFDPEGDIFLIEKLLNIDSTKDLPPSHNINPLSDSTTSSSPSLTTSEISDYSLEEKIEYLLNQDPLEEYSPNNDLIYTIPEMFTDEHTLDYSSPPRYDDVDDDLFDLMIENDKGGKVLYDDPFDSKENKIKDSKLLIDELGFPGSSSFLPHFLESDSVLYDDFFEVDTLTSTDNEDKVFNPGILVHENLYVTH